MQLSVEESMKSTVDYLDRVRKKRHRAVYDEVGVITEKEANFLLQKAQEYVSWIEIELQK
jgi:uncharacterized protein (UPF0332 family)